MKKFKFIIPIIVLSIFSIVVCACSNLGKELSAPNEGEIQVVNYNPIWGDVDANVNKISKVSCEAKQNAAKMIVFPSMSLSGYMGDSDEQLARSLAIELNDGKIAPLAKTADEQDIWIVFGAIEKKDDNLYNSTIALSPEGFASVYEEIVPTSKLFTPGDYPVCIETDWGYVGLTAGNDFLNVPEISQYYSAVNLSDELSNGPVHTCNLIVGSLAYNAGCSIDNPYTKASEWTLLNRAGEICENNSTTIAVSNLCGKQHDKMFPGGSFIFSDYFDANNKFCRSVLAGGEQNGTHYSLFVGPNYEDAVFQLKLSIDYSDWKETFLTTKNINGTICPDFNSNTKLYAQLYKELADKQDKGELQISPYPNHTDIGVATANTCCPVWGNKKAGLENMEKYIQEAGQKGNVDIIVFPEVALTGYTYSVANFDWEDYNPLTKEVRKSDGKTEAHVALAETIPGPTTQYLSEYAKKYNMYIVFGMAALPDGGLINEDGVDKCYNSAAILCPDGRIEKYNKIHLTNDEGEWSVCDDDPLMLDLDFDGQKVKVGFSICRDAQFYPEVYRYYSMCGASLLVHFSASTHNRFIREANLGSYASRDKIGLIGCNLWGTDGPGSDALTLKNTSIVCSPRLEGSSRFDEYGRDIETYGFNNQDVSPEGLEYGSTLTKGLDLYNCGIQLGSLRLEVLAKMFDELSVKYYPGYKPLYSESKSLDSFQQPIKINY